MKIVSVIQDALDSAVAQPISRPSKQQLHRERSKQFVESLASLLRLRFEDWPNVVVMSKHYDENRIQFGLNELLYDILVCEAGTTVSASGDEELTYVSKGLWSIESEFARDSRQALFDFNKLVLSSSENSVFIGPLVDDVLRFLQPLAAVAGCCTGQVYVVLVPHPADWKEVSPLKVRGFSWSGRDWTDVGV